MTRFTVCEEFYALSNILFQRIYYCLIDSFITLQMTDCSLTVLFVTANGDRSNGIYNYTETMARALNRNTDIDAETLFLSRTDMFSLKDWSHMFSRVSEHKIDVIHFQYGLTDLGVAGPLMLILLRLLTDTKVITTSHEQASSKAWYVKNTENSVLSLLAPVIVPLIYIYDILVNMLSHVIVTHTDQHAAEIVPSRLTTVQTIPHYIHPAADPETTDDGLGSLSESELETFHHRDVLTTFGRVTPKKGHSDVVRALPDMEDSIYIIAGDIINTHSNYTDELRELAEDLGVYDRVYFTDYLKEDEISKLFEYTDVAVLPYETVTQSGALYEALSRKCPVITSDLPPFLSLLSEWDIGKVYKKGDATQLISIIREIISKAESYEYAVQQFIEKNSTTVIARQHEKTYYNLICSRDDYSTGSVSR